MWELDHKGSWTPKNWCFWTVVLKKTLESPLDWKEIKPVIPKGNSSWIFIESTDSEGEAPIFAHLMWRSDSLEKTLMLGNREGKRRRGCQSQTQSPTQWTWAWPSPRSWWCTGMPGMLQSMGVAKSWTPLSHWSAEKKWTVCQVVSQIQSLLTWPPLLRDMCLFPQLVYEYFELKGKAEAHTGSL